MPRCGENRANILAQNEFKILIIDDWKGLNYPKCKVGSAEIAKVRYKAGYYLMEGVDGYDLFYLRKGTTVTALKINGHIVMVDDPMHWHGMRILASECRGKTLIGGLGLGLILHHLSQNKNATKIDVVEINKDVIDLISPFLPKDERVTIFNDDVFNEKWRNNKYDTIVLDLWTRDAGEELRIAGSEKFIHPLVAFLLFKKANPSANVYIWGYKNEAINPAYKGCSENYHYLLKQISYISRVKK